MIYYGIGTYSTKHYLSKDTKMKGMIGYGRLRY
jgi:hypothetical protein